MKTVVLDAPAKRTMQQQFCFSFGMRLTAHEQLPKHPDWLRGQAWF
jgi:hypothetical protein